MLVLNQGNPCLHQLLKSDGNEFHQEIKWVLGAHKVLDKTDKKIEFFDKTISKVNH